MSKENLTEEFSEMINNNVILLNFEGWIKYIEGFNRGLQTTDKVSSSAVLDCIGEILEYMTTFKNQLMVLLLHCESVLQENEELKRQLLTTKEDNDGEDL